MLRAAIVGLGWWGQTIAAHLADSQIIRPVLGIDPLEAARDKAAALGLQTAAEFEAALARPDIDAVILCTPQARHARQIEAAARAGRHVFCEKPLCTTGAEAERALAAVKAANVQIGLGHERRFEPAVIEMRQLLTDGEFGRALVVEGNFSQDKFLNLPRTNWRLSKAENPVGPLSATGIHMVDLSIALLGQPTTVWARLGTLGSDFANGDTLTITLGFASGATALLSAVLVTPFMGRLALIGSKGWMEICDQTHPEKPTGWTVKRNVRGAPPVTAHTPPHQAVRDNLEAFGRAAMGAAPYPITHAEMLANVKTFEAIQRSVANGQVETI